ncbi:MAG: GNAT family N-acetyltransferase [Patescibacteria group bacterium]
MEDYSLEVEPKLQSLEESAEALQEAASLVSRYSWGEDYPLPPLEEIERADHRVGVFVDGKLIAFASIGHGFSPDGIDDDALWLAHVVVAPPYRERGIFQKLYDKLMTYAQAKDERILSCTDNSIMEDFFLTHGWKKIRETLAQAGDPCDVFEYQR